MQRKAVSSSGLAVDEKEIVAFINELGPLRDIGSSGLYVIAISASAPVITVNWLIDLLRSERKGSDGDHSDYGFVLSRLEADCSDSASLNTARKDEKNYQALLKQVEVLILVDASEVKLQAIARRLQQADLQGRLSHLEEDVLTCKSLKQKLVLKELETGELLNSQERTVLFGFPNVKIYPGQSILQICKREGVVTQYFPLHQQEELRDLKSSWLSLMSRQPLEKIKSYFGESIAFYFAFLEFYTLALILPGIIGLFDFMANDSINPLTAVVNAIWTALFLKFWRRRSNELAYEWGTLKNVNYEPPRPAFRGKRMGVDPVTGKETPVYPITKTWIKEYGLSLPLILMCLYVAFQVMLFYFEVEASVVQYYKDDPSAMFGSVITHLPGVAYAVAVAIMNAYYRKMAGRLNEWENHRSQLSHENHLIVKLIVFEFANNFMSIYYVAFVMRDMSALRWQVGTMLIVYQIVDTIQEVLVPWIDKYYVEKNLNAAHEMMKKTDNEDENCGTNCQILRESKLPVYEDTYYDYLELFIQFGYVFLFSSVFPLAPLLALINNFVELRSDAFKLCSAYQRPHQRSASGIHGAWLKAFQILGIISVTTNCALLAIDNFSEGDAFQADNLRTIMLATALEHLVLLVMLFVNFIVPDTPRKVHMRLLRTHYKKVNRS